MRGFFLRLLLMLALLCPLIVPADAGAQEESSAFYWVDFHSDKDQTVVLWVERSLRDEKWTAIREIGVMYDAALVVTTLRSATDSMPSTDTFNLWSVNLKTRTATPLLKGVNLRFLDWLLLREGSPRELAAVYDNCRECAATTYFTTFHYDFDQHLLAPRWVRGGQTAPVWTDSAPPGVNLTQAYAVLAQPDGRQFLATWTHFDYGKEKPAEDFVYRYGVDDYSGLESTILTSGKKEVPAMMERICAAQPASPGLARGQDSAPCTGPTPKQPARTRERKPTTTPPANAQGRSTPPGVRK